MKKILGIAVFTCFVVYANAQFSAGIKLNLGIGGISSNNLDNNTAARQEANKKTVTDWEVRQVTSLGWGIGGFAKIKFNDAFAASLEPTLNFQKCAIDFKRTEDNRDNTGNGEVKFSTNESIIHITYLNLPLVFKYVFPSGKSYLGAGPAVNMIASPKVTSTALQQKTEYKNGLVVKGPTTDPALTFNAVFDQYAKSTFDIMVCAGKSFKLKGNEMSIDVRYGIPLTKSEMYTTNSGYNDGRFSHMDMLGLDGKTDAEKEVPAYPLNDFKFSVVQVTVGYALFSTE